MDKVCDAECGLIRWRGHDSKPFGLDASPVKRTTKPFSNDDVIFDQKNMDSFHEGMTGSS